MHHRPLQSNFRGRHFPCGMYTVFQKKTPTHIVGYKLRNSCLILIIFDTEIPDIIRHRMTA